MEPHRLAFGKAAPLACAVLLLDLGGSDDVAVEGSLDLHEHAFFDCIVVDVDKFRIAEIHCQVAQRECGCCEIPDAPFEFHFGAPGLEAGLSLDARGAQPVTRADKTGYLDYVVHGESVEGHVIKARARALHYDRKAEDVQQQRIAVGAGLDAANRAGKLVVVQNALRRAGSAIVIYLPLDADHHAYAQCILAAGLAIDDDLGVVCFKFNAVDKDAAEPIDRTGSALTAAGCTAATAAGRGIGYGVAGEAATATAATAGGKDQRQCAGCYHGLVFAHSVHGPAPEFPCRVLFADAR